MKWNVEFEGAWLTSNDTTRALQRHGYAVGVFHNDTTDAPSYTLHRKEDKGYPIVFETNDIHQLNAYVNLLLSSED